MNQESHLDKGIKLEPTQPRFLRYRTHYRVYLLFMLTLSVLVLGYWGYRLWMHSWDGLWRQQSFEILATLTYFIGVCCTYFFWLRSRLNRSVQVYPDHLKVHKGKIVQEIHYENIESISIIGWSLFFLKMKSGYKHYFNSGLERIDYVWEGIMHARPDLMSSEEWEKFRLNLVQYDHHQKRKEWFFKHKLVDVVNWIILPFVFLGFAHLVQSRQIIIHQQGLYFFRLFMYALMVLLITAFFYSIVLKKFVFDRQIKRRMEQEPGDKIRDIEFEGIIVQRSKLFQIITACFLFTFIVKTDLNLFSVTKLRGDLANLNIQTGKTTIVDNRYNCLYCRYSISDGDLVMFGRGHVGQVIAREGELVGEVSKDPTGRTIASENVIEVPKGHVALKTPNGKDIVFVKVEELIGKLQN